MEVDGTRTALQPGPPERSSQNRTSPSSACHTAHMDTPSRSAPVCTNSAQLEPKTFYVRHANLIHRSERLPEPALPKPRTIKLAPPNEIRVRKDHLNRLLPGALDLAVRIRPADDASRLDRIAHDLDVERPVARVVEDEDGGNARLGEIDCLGRVRASVARLCDIEGRRTFVLRRSSSERSWNGQTLRSVQLIE